MHTHRPPDNALQLSPALDNSHPTVRWDGEPFFDWAYRMATWYLLAEPDTERDRR